MPFPPFHMNYITHTRAAFAFLAAEPTATAQHVSLYVALFQRWNAARFAPTIVLLRDELMADAHLGSRSTYLNCLRDLGNWGLLTYYPSQSQHVPSRATLHELALPEMEDNSQPTETSPWPKSGPSGGQSKGPTSEPTRKQAPGQAQGQAVGPSTKRDKKSAENRVKNQPSNKSNAAAAGANEKTEGSSAEVLLSRKPSQGNAPSRQNRPGSYSMCPEVPFSESDLFPIDAFLAAFADTDFALANLRYYHEKVTSWRQNGIPPRRRDWLATAKQFMLNDVERNALVLAPAPRPAYAGAPGHGYVSARYA